MVSILDSGSGNRPEEKGWGSTLKSLGVPLVNGLLLGMVVRQAFTTGFLEGNAVKNFLREGEILPQDTCPAPEAFVPALKGRLVEDFKWRFGLNDEGLASRYQNVLKDYFPNGEEAVPFWEGREFYQSYVAQISDFVQPMAEEGDAVEAAGHAYHLREAFKLHTRDALTPAGKAFSEALDEARTGHATGVPFKKMLERKTAQQIIASSSRPNNGVNGLAHLAGKIHEWAPESAKPWIAAGLDGGVYLAAKVIRTLTVLARCF